MTTNVNPWKTDYNIYKKNVKKTKIRIPKKLSNNRVLNHFIITPKKV